MEKILGARKSVLKIGIVVAFGVLLLLSLTLYTQGSTFKPTENRELNGVFMEGQPKIWYCDRVLIVEQAGVKIPKHVLDAFLSPDANLFALGSPVSPTPVEYSCRPDVGRCFYGGKVCFSHAVRGDGWRIEWGMYYCGTDKPVETRCEEPKACGVYFTGIGCPHCALTDPWLFYEFVPKHPVVVVEYEIYRDAAANGPVMDKYVKKYGKYGAVPGVPQLIFDENHIIVGDMPLIKELNAVISEVNVCTVPWLMGSMKKYATQEHFSD